MNAVETWHAETLGKKACEALSKNGFDARYAATKEEALAYDLLGEVTDERIATARRHPHQVPTFTGAGVSQQLQLRVREHRQSLRDLARQPESGRGCARLERVI